MPPPEFRVWFRRPEWCLKVCISDILSSDADAAIPGPHFELQGSECQWGKSSAPWGGGWGKGIALDLLVESECSRHGSSQWKDRRGLAWLIRSIKIRLAWLEKVLDEIWERGRKEPNHVGLSLKGNGNSLKRMLSLIVVLPLFCLYIRGQVYPVCLPRILLGMNQAQSRGGLQSKLSCSSLQHS